MKDKVKVSHCAIRVPSVSQHFRLLGFPVCIFVNRLASIRVTECLPLAREAVEEGKKNCSSNYVTKTSLISLILSTCSSPGEITPDWLMPWFLNDHCQKQWNHQDAMLLLSPGVGRGRCLQVLLVRRPQHCVSN